MSTSLGLYFSSTDYVLALPMVLLALFALGILLIDLLLPKEWKRVNAFTALAGLAFSAVAVGKLQFAYRLAEQKGNGGEIFSGFMGALVVDRFAIYFFYLFLIGAAIAILMSMRYLEIERENHGEFYALLLFSVVGMMCMAAGYDIVLLFIGLELMAISTYVLVGFLRRDKRSNEAALKYLLLGAFSSGLFAYGLSLFYGLTGSTHLGVIARKLQEVVATRPHDPVVAFALLTTTVGLLFKIAAVPFHQWAPDAYEGAPTSVTGFMSVAVKSAAWALLLRIFLFGLGPLRSMYVPLLIFVSIATMTLGNLAAISQNNLKRLLAYSSIAHVGYMLLGLVASDGVNNSTGIMAIMIYLLVYTFMNLGAFAVITSLRRRSIIGDEMDDIAGLYFKAPVETMLMLVFLLSLSGIPPLAGFWGKYFIFLSLIQTGHYGLASLAVLYSVIGLYYYMRIASAMLIKPAADTEPVRVGPAMGLALVVTAAGTIGIGIFPNFFINAVNWSLGLTQSSHVAMLFR
ncbi:MAG TPA: NADH-quinone oxidoreductase subunit N [Candidatus Eisenbacteria bacterium]|nr:NADH-quinone oxidoreductase subunit N [Candidatus Eisenbacteria bacterium]